MYTQNDGLREDGAVVKSDDVLVPRDWLREGPSLTPTHVSSGFRVDILLPISTTVPHTVPSMGLNDAFKSYEHSTVENTAGIGREAGFSSLIDIVLLCVNTYWRTGRVSSNDLLDWQKSIIMTQTSSLRF